jgi:phage shock protein A
MIKRVLHFFKSIFSSAVTELEKTNPDALLESEKENLRKQIQRYNQGLAAHAAMVEKLIAQVNGQEQQETNLLTKIKANVTAGNQEIAGRQALKLTELRTELAINRDQLEAAENTYQEMSRNREASIKEAQKKIESLQAKINELKVKEATADLSEMASSMTADMGGASATMNRLESMVEDARAKAAGRARVAQDSMPALDDIPSAEEERALAHEALKSLSGELGFTTAVESKGEEIPVVTFNELDKNEKTK